MSRTVGVIGASGAVGRTMCAVLRERGVAAGSLRLLASERSRGREIDYGKETLTIEELTEDRLRALDLALFALDDEMARRWVPIARAAGVTVVDNSAVYRMDPAVPLVIPEINGHLLEDRPGLVANPNCSTIVMLMALAPIVRVHGLRRLVAATYQSASGAGAEAMQELESGTRAILSGEKAPAEVFPVPLAFDCLPLVGRMRDDGRTREESKMLDESRRILARSDLRAAFTCVRVPTFVSHAVAAHFETESPASPDDVRALLRDAPGVLLGDGRDEDALPTPRLAEGRDEVFVGRIRSDGLGLALFAVGDNLRKGAATNAVQIALALGAGTS